MEPSWVVGGSILGSTIINIQLVYNGFVQITFVKKITLGRAYRMELGMILMPERIKKAPTLDPN